MQIKVQLIGKPLAAVLVLLMTPGSDAFAQQKMSLAQIIDNVKANEALYRNIEVRSIAKLTSMLQNGYRERTIATSESKYRCVLQGELLYVKYESDFTTSENKRKKYISQAGFDGALTRVFQNKTGNVVEKRVEPADVFRPHTQMLPKAHVYFPLSLWLAAGEPLKAHRYAGLYRNWEVRVNVEANEEVDGLECIRIRHELWDPGKPPVLNTTRLLWLAVERNYLPVKSVGFVPSYSKEIPLGIAKAEDFRELAPGVWLPFRQSITVFEELQAKAGKRVESSKKDYVVEEATLDPKYDVEFFRDIKFPTEALVYEINGDNKLKNSYFVPNGDQNSEFWIYFAILLVLALILSFYLLKRRKRRMLT